MNDFDARCQRCPRLTANLAAVRESHPDYHCAPVAALGARNARLLIVGLAPGLHGANRSGRPFTGDASGSLLFRALHAAGFCNQPESVGVDDGLKLKDCRITNAVKCLPPGNRPIAAELSACRSYLQSELAQLWRPAMRNPRCVLALGRIAHQAVLKALGSPALNFGHGVRHRLAPGFWLLDSYHPSRQNVNTGRLDYGMLRAIMLRARDTLDGL